MLPWQSHHRPTERNGDTVVDVISALNASDKPGAIIAQHVRMRILTCVYLVTRKAFVASIRATS
jgi:hypothetical protein